MRLPLHKSMCLIVLALVFAAGCKSRTPSERYPFHGFILQIDQRAHQALIQHEDVPGLMKGMTMPFTVRDEKVFASLKPGDVIDATLVKQEYKAWLENVKVVGHQNIDDNKPATSETPHRPTAGESVPDFAFTNQNGKHVRLAQLQGHPVLITFIYTRCPVPDFCPRMNANLLAVLKKVQDPKLQLLSVSFDPENDTPAALRSYSQHWTDELPAAQRWNWQFVAPKKADLKPILTFFGMSADPDGEWISHTLSTTLIAPDGKVAAWYPGNDWTPDDVAQDLAKLQGGRPTEATRNAAHNHS